MASVSGTSNNLNSLYNTYGNANTVTGLASGMDTETMIEQAVSGLQKKIESLQQRQTMIQWKQAELRSMITMLSNLNSNYTSYRSKTNLLSPSFFTTSMTSGITGANADKISVIGGSNSSIAINSVSKLATAATYRVDAGTVFGGADGKGEAINWRYLNLSDESSDRIYVTLDGVSKEIRISDLAKDLSTITDTNKLASALQTQLDKAFGTGRVTVENNDGALQFGASGGSTVKVQSSLEKLGLGTGVKNYVDISGTMVADALCKNNGDGTYTYDGKTYTADKNGRLVDGRGNALALEINGTAFEITTTTSIAGLLSNINLSDAGVTASYSQLTNQLTFTAKETGSGGKIDFGGALKSAFQPDNFPMEVNAASVFGNLKWNEDGQAEIIIDGADRIYLSKTDTMKDLINKIEDLGPAYRGMIKYDFVSGSYGVYDMDGNPMDGSKITFSQPGSDTTLTLSDLVGNANSVKGSFTAGEDAELNVTINGVATKLTRASNTFDIDGVSITLKETFNVDEDGNEIAGAEPVTLTGKVDTESIISAIKSFAEEFNALIKTVHEAYSTQPLEKNSSSHTKYSPLTDTEKEGLSEKAIEEYEEKAKTGMFFMDNDLSALYSRLRGILMNNQGALSEIGISIEYDKESRTNFLEVNEERLAAALENNINDVMTIFAGKDGEGGMMSEVQSVANDYASTSIGAYGILVRKAGAAESAISQRDSAYQKDLERLETQIDKLRDKIGSRIDYYSRQFSMLEQLMSSYNNQSSMLMSMMGY